MILAALCPNKPTFMQPAVRKPLPTPDTLFVQTSTGWVFVMGAITAQGNTVYPAGTVFGPYASYPEADAATARLTVQAIAPLRFTRTRTVPTLAYAMAA